MFEKGRHYLKRALGGVGAAAIFAAVLYGSSAKDIRLTRQVDGDYSGITPAPANNVDELPLVNINTATAHHLQRLDGIGDTVARAIVEYRVKNGRFSSPDELVNVRGIGGKTLERIRDRVTV